MPKPKNLTEGTPALEWIAAGVGLVILLILISAIGRDALTGDSTHEPSIEMKAIRIEKAASGYTVVIEAVNEAGGTAAALQIEGVLQRGAKVVERSVGSIDYVPGHGSARAGLYFSQDPRSGSLRIRPVGYQKP